MGKVLHNRTGLQYLYVLMMISFTFQLSSQIPILQRHYIFWVVGYILALSYSQRYLLQPVANYAFIYLLFVWANFFTGDVYFSKFTSCIEETNCLIVTITLLYYLFSRNDKKLFYWIFVIFSIFLVESSLVSYYANLNFPNIMRLQSNAESAEANAFLLDPFKKIGLASYSLPHALPIIIPALVYVTKKTQKFLKIRAIVVLGASWLLLYASGSFTALTLGTVILVIALIFNAKNTKGVIISSVVLSALLLPLLISEELMLNVVRYFQTITPDNTLFSNKLMDIESSLLYDTAEGSVSSRTDAYTATFEAFFSSPLWGINGKVGGHCALIDRLATLGLLGYIPLLCFLVHQIRFTLNYIKNETKFYYYLGLVSGITMMCLKGTGGWDMWFCLLVMLPGILWWLDNDVINKEYIKKVKK